MTWRYDANLAAIFEVGENALPLMHLNTARSDAERHALGRRTESLPDVEAAARWALEMLRALGPLPCNMDADYQRKLRSAENLLGMYAWPEEGA